MFSQFQLGTRTVPSRPRSHLVNKSSLSRPHLVLVLSPSPTFEIYLVLVPTRTEDELGRGPSQDDSSRHTDPWSITCFDFISSPRFSTEIKKRRTVKINKNVTVNISNVNFKSLHFFYNPYLLH